MSLQELMERFQLMSDRRRKEDAITRRARLFEDIQFEARKQLRLQALESELSGRIPSYESRSVGAIKVLKTERDNECAELQRRHAAQLRALQKRQDEEMAAVPEKYTRKAAEVERKLRIDMQWELDLLLEVEQSILGNTIEVERRRALEARDREDKIREQARAVMDHDVNSQVLVTFREEASRHNQSPRDVAPELPSPPPLRSILKKPRSVTVNKDGTVTIATSEDDTLDDRKIKRVKVERSPRRGRAVDVLDEEATLFPYRENEVPSSQTPRSPRSPQTPRTAPTPRTPRTPRTAEMSRSTS